MTAQKPAWSRSGLLHPQDLQFQSRYIEEVVAFRAAAVAPDSWGLFDLKFDKSALSSGVLRITQLEGRMPSGLPFAISESDPALELAVPPVAMGQTGTTVRLAVAGVAGESPNVMEAGQNDAVRFVRPAASSPPGLRPRLRLVVEEGALADWETIPIARVTSRAGRLEIQAELLPPMIRVLPDSFVMARRQSLVEILKTRRDELLGARQGRPLELRTLHPTQIPRLLVLSTISQALAVLVDGELLASQTPRELYLFLDALLGTLEAIDGTDDGVVARPPGYVHEAPGPGFRALFDRLAGVIPTAAREPHIAIALQRRDASTFVATAPDSTVFRKRIFLVATGMDETFLRTHLPAYAKLAGPNAFSHVVQRSLPGVLLAPEFDPPPSLPNSANHVCFRLDVRSEYWPEVLERGSLFVYVPQAPSELTLTLYALDR